MTSITRRGLTVFAIILLAATAACEAVPVPTPTSSRTGPTLPMLPMPAPDHQPQPVGSATIIHLAHMYDATGVEVVHAIDAIVDDRTAGGEPAAMLQSSTGFSPAIFALTNTPFSLTDLLLPGVIGSGLFITATDVPRGYRLTCQTTNFEGTVIIDQDERIAQFDNDILEVDCIYYR